MRYLPHQDNLVSLALFLMLINPGAKMGRKFEYWTWPKTDYEMDHAGQLIEINRDVYVYSGRGSKGSHTSTYPHNDSGT